MFHDELHRERVNALEREAAMVPLFWYSWTAPKASAEEERRCQPGNYFVPGNLLLSSPQSSRRELEDRSLDFRIEPAREMDTLPSASAEVRLLKSQCRPGSYPGLCCKL